MTGRSDVRNPCFRLNRVMDWLRQVWQPTQPFQQPDSVDPTIKLVADAFGSSRLDFTQIESQLLSIGPGVGDQRAFMAPAADGFLRLILAASATHNDAVARQVWFNVGQAAFLYGVGVQSWPTVSQNGVAVMGGRVLVPESYSFGVSIEASSAATTLTANVVYVDLPIGEYSPAV